MIRRHMGRWPAAVWAGIVSVALSYGIAAADEESDRRDLITKIESKLEYAASKLSGFESDSDSGDLNDALSYVREVESLISELSRVKGSDSKANDIVSRYPDYVRSFREAAQYVAKVKQGQRVADGAADKCKDDEANLQSLIRSYVSDPDNAQDAFSKLPDKAKDLGQQWSSKTSAWKQHHSDMSTHVSYARFSVSDGKWSSVSSYMAESVSRMWGYWKERYEAADRACSRLALGERHPDVERALQDLRIYKGNVKETYRTLKADYDSWLSEVKKLRELTQQDREEIRKVMCSAGEYEVDQKVKEVADRWANNISSVYSTILGQADRLQRRADDIKKRAPKAAPKLIRAIQDNLATLEKLKNYELQGSNNPKIRTKLEYGKSKHRDMQSGCSYKELEISSSYCSNAIRPGSGCSVDCVQTSSTCTIIEIKPNNSRARDDGDSQVRSYEEGLRQWHRKDKASLFSKYSSLQQCEKSDGSGLELRTEVRTYDFCPSSTSEFGEELRDVSSDVSSEVE